MRFKRDGYGGSIWLPFILSMALAGCGSGSSNSGAGTVYAAESPESIPTTGSIPFNIPTPITQNGQYDLPNVEFETDVTLDNCPNAVADATATSAATGQVFFMTCKGGPIIAPNFPPGGGILMVDLNSGNPISVWVAQVVRVPRSNR